MMQQPPGWLVHNIQAVMLSHYSANASGKACVRMQQAHELVAAVIGGAAAGCT